MSGFVAATRNHDDPDLQRHLRQMSQEMVHRGNREVTEVFSARCATVVRFRDHSGYRVHTYSNEQFAIVVDGLIFNKSELGPRRTSRMRRSVSCGTNITTFRSSQKNQERIIS